MEISYKTIVGSNLYGLNTSTSDTDFKGFGLPDVDAIIGLKRQEQDESKSLEKNEEGTIFSLNKFIHLSMKGNPTVFEVSFADPKFHIIQTDLGKRVCDFVKNNLVTKHVFAAYSAYFRAQQRDSFSQNRTGDRIEFIQKYGFDIKSASHAIRLGKQCVQIMQTGTLNPTLTPEEREEPLRCKLGQMSATEAKNIMTDLDKKMYDVYKLSELPEKPDFEAVNKFMIDIYYKHIKTEMSKR